MTLEVGEGTDDDGNGIGDAPHEIFNPQELGGDLAGVDEFPLMKPRVPHDVGITKLAAGTVVGQGCSVDVNLKIVNYGANTENINVTAYVGIFALQTQTVSLSSGDSTTVTFRWNTSGFAKGNYTVSAYAWPVEGEADLTDNTFVGGFVIVAMIGDITGPSGWPDGKVDIRDIALVAKHFGQNAPPAPANCDITDPITGVPDGKIDIRDIAIVAKEFGKVDP